LVFILSASAQEKLVGTYGEARTSLAFKIADATAQSILPRGWLTSPFSAGPSKGANLVVTFMDWLVALDPDGRPTNTFRHVGLYPGLGVEAVRLVPAQNRGLAMGAYTIFLDVALGFGTPALGLPSRSGRSVRRQHAGCLGRGGHSSSPSVQVVCAAQPRGARVPVSTAVKSEEKT
jgi:hypothetical protein